LSHAGAIEIELRISPEMLGISVALLVAISNRLFAAETFSGLQLVVRAKVIGRKFRWHVAQSRVTVGGLSEGRGSNQDCYSCACDDSHHDIAPLPDGMLDRITREVLERLVVVPTLS
jgi:hypothetical protein